MLLFRWGNSLYMPKSIGTWLIIGGIVLVIMGVLANVGWLSWFGRLPGDIRIERENMRFYFPIASMIIISVVLTLIFYLLGRFWK
jgi:membrane protein implicated in regulation of membrane protease activity